MLTGGGGCEGGGMPEGRGPPDPGGGGFRPGMPPGGPPIGGPLPGALPANPPGPPLPGGPLPGGPPIGGPPRGPLPSGPPTGGSTPGGATIGSARPIVGGLRFSLFAMEGLLPPRSSSAAALFLSRTFPLEERRWKDRVGLMEYSASSSSRTV
jgi:hypothetical protein